MSSNGKDRDWQRLSEATRPTLASVRRTEQELQELQREGVPPLDAAHVERLLARTHGRIVDREPRRLARRARLVATAATVLLTAMVGVAMRAHEVFWPTMTSPMLTLAFEEAIDDVSDEASDTSDWTAGIGFLDGRCADGLKALLELRDSRDDEVARAAAAACRRIAEGKSCPVSGAHTPIARAIEAANAPGARRAERLAAVHRVEELVRTGVEAMRAASTGSEMREQIKAAYVDRLEAELAPLRETNTGPKTPGPAGPGPTTSPVPGTEQEPDATPEPATAPTSTEPPEASRPSPPAL